MKISKKLLHPLYFFIFVWLSYICIRNLFISWQPLSEVTIFVVLFFICFVIFCYVVFIILFITGQRLKRVGDASSLGIKKINKIYYFLLFISIFYIIIATTRFLIELDSLNISLNYASASIELREKTMNGSVVSGTPLGILVTSLSGFHILLLMFSMWEHDRLSIVQLNLARFIFVVGDITFLFGGGRNSIFVSFIMILLCFYFIRFANVRKIAINKIGIFVCAILIMIVFLYIFIARDEYNGISMIDRIKLNEYFYKIKFSDFWVDLIYSESKIISTVLYFILYLVFYLTHSLYILDLGLVSNLPQNAYYFGSMEFYPIVTILNKLGFNIITIGDILEEWELAGNYATLLLPLYYDFGPIGALAVVAILVLLFVYNTILLLRNKNFISCIALAIISSVFIFSPIYSFFSLGIFLPIFFSFVVLYVFLK